jgi:arabinogalactan endo-1,4-beta-galactosidase
MNKIGLLLFFYGTLCGCVPTPSTVFTPKSNSQQTVFYSPNTFVMGSDLSFVNQIEDYGAVFRDSSKIKDVFKIVKQHGNNLVRVRLWHSPLWTETLNNGKQYSNLQDVVKTIRRAKAEGMYVNLDLHYSDTWADPNTQKIPKAWEDLPLNVLKDSVYQYTFKTLKYLQNLNLTPEMIQIGNENNNGVLWPTGKIDNNNFQNFTELLKSGARAVRDFSVNSAIKPQIVIHCAQLQFADWWVDGVVNKGGLTDFDIIGLSHYYKWSTVNDMAAIGSAIKALKTKYLSLIHI